MSEPPDVVVFGSFPFRDRLPLGDWQLARAFARIGARVLFIDPPFGPRSLLRGPLPSWARRGAAWSDPSGVFEAAPFGVSATRPWILGGLQNRMVRWQAQRWMRKLGFHQAIVVTGSPERGTFDGLPRAALVYWQKDRQYESRRYARPDWIRRQHAEVLHAADVVTAVSPTIVADNEHLGVGATFIPNGCDLTLFAEARDEPSELAGLPRPRLVYVGAYKSRVDHTIIPELASARPDWSFVIIANVSEPLPPNVHVLGIRDVADVPAYLQHCVVGLIPYARSEFNDASCPLKVYEYLAAGLPMVVSGIDIGADFDRELIPSADGTQHWTDAIERHLADLPTRRQRARDLAAQNSWDARARRVLELVSMVCDRRR